MAAKASAYHNDIESNNIWRQWRISAWQHVWRDWAWHGENDSGVSIINKRQR